MVCLSAPRRAPFAKRQKARARVHPQTHHDGQRLRGAVPDRHEALRVRARLLRLLELHRFDYSKVEELVQIRFTVLPGKCANYNTR